MSAYTTPAPSSTPSRSFAGRRQASAQPSQASGGKSSGGMPMPGALDSAQRQQIDAQTQMFSNTIAPGMGTADQNSAGQTGESALRPGIDGVGPAQSLFNQYQSAIFGPQPGLYQPAFDSQIPPGSFIQGGPDRTTDFMQTFPGLVGPQPGDMISNGLSMRDGRYENPMIGTTDEPAPVNTMPQIPSDNQGGAAGQPPNPPVNPLLDVLKQYAPAAAPLVQQNIPQPVAQPPRPTVGAPQPSFANRAARTRAPQMQPSLPPPAQAPRPVSRPGARVRFR